MLVFPSSDWQFTVTTHIHVDLDSKAKLITSAHTTHDRYDLRDLCHFFPCVSLSSVRVSLRCLPLWALTLWGGLSSDVPDALSSQSNTHKFKWTTSRGRRQVPSSWVFTENSRRAFPPGQRSHYQEADVHHRMKTTCSKQLVNLLPQLEAHSISLSGENRVWTSLQKTLLTE